MTDGEVSLDVKAIVNRMADLYEKFEEKGWVPCPACHEDVAHLRPCTYYELGVEKHNNLCVSCAESVMVLPWLATQYPIEGVQIEMLWRELEVTKDRPPRMQQAIVSHLDVYKQRVWCRGTKLAAINPDIVGGEVKEYGNIFEFWFAFKADMAKKPPQQPEDDNWGGDRRRTRPRFTAA